MSNTVVLPYCAELIQAEAIKCKHCGSDLSEFKGAEYLTEDNLNALVDKLRKQNGGS